MKLENLTSSELLSYSTILENIITTTTEIEGEANRAVSGGFCEVKEIQKIMDKTIDSRVEADEIYSEIQKELDKRVKRDLGMKFGIRRTQAIIKEFDAFVHNKNLEHKAKFEANEKAKKENENEEAVMATMSIATEEDDTVD